MNKMCSDLGLYLKAFRRAVRFHKVRSGVNTGVIYPLTTQIFIGFLGS